MIPKQVFEDARKVGLDVAKLIRKNKMHVTFLWTHTRRRMNLEQFLEFITGLMKRLYLERCDVEHADAFERLFHTSLNLNNDERGVIANIIVITALATHTELSKMEKS